MANKKNKGMTNNLAKEINAYIKHKGITKTHVAKEMGISASYLQSLLEKDNFTIDDANRILAVIGAKIEYNIVNM